MNAVCLRCFSVLQMVGGVKAHEVFLIATHEVSSVNTPRVAHSFIHPFCAAGAAACAAGSGSSRLVGIAAYSAALN
jgi:hypothetical protein